MDAEILRVKKNIAYHSKSELIFHEISIQSGYRNLAESQMT